MFLCGKQQMSDGYTVAKSGKLKLKGNISYINLASIKESHKNPLNYPLNWLKKKLGESSGHKHKSKKSKKDKSKEAKSDPKVEDELNHAGAWLVENLNQITGTIVIELKEYSYMHGLDNGLFVMGAPHEVALHFLLFTER